MGGGGNGACRASHARAFCGGESDTAQGVLNDKLGIKFGAGDIDLGKNTAGGSGGPHQCENIVCS